MDNNKEFQTQESGLLPFDPIILLMDVCKRWLIILAAAVVVGVGAYIFTDISYTPSYRTNATLVVSSRGSGSTVYTNLSSASALANVFTELLNSSILRQKALESSVLESFNGTITSSVIPNTNLITIQVTASDPRESFLMTRALLEHHEELTYQIIGDVVVEVLQKPALPVAPSNPLNTRGAMKTAMLITAVLVCLLLAFLSYSRDTVRSGKEVRKKLDCWYLGEIPHEEKYRTLRAKIRRPKSSVLITNPTVSFHFVETIRKIRRRIEQQMNGRSGEELYEQIVEMKEQFSIMDGKFSLLDQPWVKEKGMKSISWLWLIPLISGLTSFFVSWISMSYSKKSMPQDQPGQGCTNNMMLIYMPIFSTWIAFTVPGAVGVYWIFSNVLSVAQTIIVNKIYDPAKARAEAEAAYLERPRQKEEDKKRLAKARQREEALARQEEQERERQREESREMNKKKKKGQSGTHTNATQKENAEDHNGTDEE